MREWIFLTNWDTPAMSTQCDFLQQTLKMNVVSVHFFAHKTACDVDTDTCFDDFRNALGAKYGTPQTITAPRSNGKPSYLYSLKNGTITLKKSADKVELIYSDDTTIYDKILAEKAKIARNKYLESLNRDI